MQSQLPSWLPFLLSILFHVAIIIKFNCFAFLDNCPSILEWSSIFVIYELTKPHLAAEAPWHSQSLLLAVFVTGNFLMMVLASLTFSY